MYLSKLEIHGFKSFAERTALQFDPGVTAIVGPNGCGKSNIVDAVRWVIGEQRARVLRSEKMDNVIFNGTAKKRPLGMAEVMLTVENTRGILPIEYSEVTLGRRLFRSGESEYLLNGVKCRLQDILDLFMDTGMGAGAYSVIELKMVEEILSENAQDRRRLFEEAAGITKYKLRRRQTLGKLEETRGDLTRLNDLVEEVGKQVRTLKRQAEKAAKYREYETRLHELELALSQAEYDRLSAQQRTLETEIAGLKERSATSSRQLVEQEARLETLKNDLYNREQALNERRRRLGQHREAIRAGESDLRLERERLEAWRRDLDRLDRERAEANTRRADLELQAGRLRKELAETDPMVAEAAMALGSARTIRDQARVAAEEERRMVQELRRKVEAADQEFTAARRNLDRTANRLELLEQEQARYGRQSAEAQEGIEQLEARVRFAAQELDTARIRLDEARTALQGAAAVRQETESALEAAREALRQLERRRGAVAAELGLLESLVSSYEDFSDAVQYLAAESTWTSSGLLTVADVLTCADDVRAALDAALGDLASCIVVRSEVEARQAMAMLRADGRGQASFIVLDRLPLPRVYSEPDPMPEGAELLSAYVQATDELYQPLIEPLLTGCFLVNTLEQASYAAKSYPYDARLVTQAGEWVDTRGLMKGGSHAATPSLLANRLTRREQRDTARTSLAELNVEIGRAEAGIQQLQRALAAIPYEQHRHAAREAEQAFVQAERAHERAAYEKDTLARRQTEVAGRLASLDADLISLRQEVSALQGSVGGLEVSLAALRQERSTAEETFAGADAESRAADSRFNETNVAAVQARNRQENLQRDLERTGGALTEIAARAGTREQDLAALIEQIRTSQKRAEALQGQLDSLHGRDAELEGSVASADHAVSQVRVALSDVEARLRTLRDERESFIRDEHQREVRLVEIQTRTCDLLDHIREDFGRALDEAPVELEEAFDERAARTEVLDLRSKIKGLGVVNALALESYDEEAARYDFLTAQQADLQQAESTLVSTIQEINTTAAARFRETFEAVRESFVRLFVHLFGEDAAAELELVDPGDLLESPIEIMAKPRGKRPSTIAQLSGGEKTLTAIALLFAIYLVKPSPFCILDEVDAPLDEANINRFMDLIREFSRSTQFILVTHNKRTMELADRMYGITMQEQGVSKLVAVDFRKVEETEAEAV